MNELHKKKFDMHKCFMLSCSVHMINLNQTATSEVQATVMLRGTAQLLVRDNLD
jgi:hypothetical protein